MPFGDYPDFQACVRANQDKPHPEAFCAWLHREITGRWPTDMSKAEDYTTDMPADCAEAFNFFVKGFMKVSKDEDAAIEYGVNMLKTAGWQKRNGKWNIQKDHKLVTREVGPVQIFKAGTWNGDEYTVSDIDAMILAYTELKGFVDPPVQIGHTSDAFNIMLAEKMGVPKELITGDHGKGAMALGWISKMWREGDVLVATLSDIPEPLGLLIEAKSYKPVSVTVMWDYKFMGKTYPKVINSVSLLGFERQAVGEIQGLETAGVFTEIEDSKVVTFDEEFNLTEGDVHRDSDVTEDDLEATFTALSNAAEAAIRNKKGARIFRTLLGEIKGKMRNFLPKKAALAEIKEVNKEELAMTPENLIILAKLLGLAEDASAEQIIEAVTALKAKAESGPAEAEAAAKTDSEMTDMKEKVKDYADRLGKTELALAEETRARKISEYSAVCSQFKHIEGKPEAMAKTLVDLEAYSPELAWSELLRYAALNRAQEATGATIGNPLESDGQAEVHPFKVKVAALQAEKKVTYAEALNQCSKLYRDEYVAYRKAN